MGKRAGALPPLPLPPAHSAVVGAEDIEAQIERVRVELERRGDLMAALAVAMSGQRREAAAALKGAVETALHSLGMPHSRFECRLDWVGGRKRGPEGGLRGCSGGGADFGTIKGLVGWGTGKAC